MTSMQHRMVSTLKSFCFTHAFPHRRVLLETDACVPCWDIEGLARAVCILDVCQRLDCLVGSGRRCCCARRHCPARRGVPAPDLEGTPQLLPRTDPPILGVCNRSATSRAWHAALRFALRPVPNRVCVRSCASLLWRHAPCGRPAQHPVISCSLTGAVLRAQTHCWRLVDMASGAPLADIVANASVSSLHISADAGGRLQVQRL